MLKKRVLELSMLLCLGELSFPCYLRWLTQLNIQQNIGQTFLCIATTLPEMAAVIDAS
jgi:hypothetical protein